MQNYIKVTIALLMISITSCSDVVEVEVQEGATRLVIEASINWEKETTGNEQVIKLSTSTEFFDTTNDTNVTGASVSVTNDTNGTEFIFVDQSNGKYTTTEFIPILNQSYTLEVIYNGENYTAQETLTSVSNITDLFQEGEGDIDDPLEVRIEFEDPADEENFYLFKFQKEGELFPGFRIGSDKFSNGNVFDFGYGIDEDEETEKIEAFAPGDVVTIDMYGISEAYYDYMDILIGQRGGVGLFAATPVAVKGNCINLTTPDNYAYGYFRLTEVNKTSYMFE